MQFYIVIIELNNGGNRSGCQLPNLTAILKKTRALISFSRVGKPQDNPEMESFFGRLKDEWKSTFYQAKTGEEIFRLISEAIVYYNTKRIHSNHKDKSPDEFLSTLLKF